MSDIDDKGGFLVPKELQSELEAILISGKTITKILHIPPRQATIILRTKDGQEIRRLLPRRRNSFIERRCETVAEDCRES